MAHKEIELISDSPIQISVRRLVIPRKGEMVRHLPSEPLAVSALPPITSRDEYEAARARLLVREKAPPVRATRSRPSAAGCR